MKIVKTIDAQGLILYQDITKIVKGEYKGVLFKKGHQVTAEDIPILLSVGKEHLFLESETSTKIHENEAADFLYHLIAGEYMTPTVVSEGKIEVIAELGGLLKVDKQALFELNSVDGVAVATRKTNQKITAGQKIAGTRIIPLEIEAEVLQKAEEKMAGRSVLSLIPFQPVVVGIVITGSEIFNGLIEDGFTHVIHEKLASYQNVTIKFHEIVNDQSTNITQAVENMVAKGADIIICTGGMSVDPDDRTPLGIKQTGAKIITHGTPVLPGSMFLLAYLQKSTIIGLPGGALFSAYTVFDLLLPRLMAQDKVSRNEIIALGYGGYL